MKRLWIAAISAALAACGQNNVGSTPDTDAGTTATADAGTTDAGNPITNSCIPANFTCSGAGGLAYPGCPYGVSRGSIFPDFGLGDGYWNTSTTPINDLTLTPELAMAFHLLYCSGFKYAFIDISAVWCPHCRDEAAAFPGWNVQKKLYEWNPTLQTGWAVKWLPMGGIIFSLLEQGNDPANPATMADLTAWVTQYNTNYPMAIDPQENIVSGVGLAAWPANIILDLSTMKVVDVVFGNQPNFLTEFDNLLAASK